MKAVTQRELREFYQQGAAQTSEQLYERKVRPSLASFERSQVLDLKQRQDSASKRQVFGGLSSHNVEKQLLKSPLKKLPTFYEIFQQHVDEHEAQQHHLRELQSDKVGESYSIYEDLKLLLSLNCVVGEKNAQFKLLSEQRVLNRSYESIKTRYMQFLKGLQ